MNRRSIAIFGLGAAIVLFIAVNVVAGAALRYARLDLTAERLFTLSSGTRNVLASLKEPVTLALYFSEKLSDEVGSFKIYGTRVRELLQEYAARAGGRIALKVVDPEPFSEAEDDAVQAGVQGLAIDNTSGRQFYLGLVGTNPKGHKETIPFFDQARERFLEYDLTKFVYNLTQPKKPVVGVIGDMPLEYGPGGIMAAMRGIVQPYAIYNQMRELFDVRVLKGDIAAIDDDVALLLIVRPQNLSPKTLYAVDQFVLRKGRAMVFVDPYAETAALGGPMGADPTASKGATLPKLLEAWGLEMVNDRFVADRLLGLPIEPDTPSGRGRLFTYPAWIGLKDEFINRDDLVTAELGVLYLGSAGSLKPREGSGVTFTPLFTSSNESALVETSKLGPRPDPEALLKLATPTRERYTFAARITGNLKTAFPEGPPPPEKKEAKDDKDKKEEKKDGDASAEVPEKKQETPPKPHVATSAAPANLIVVADTDMLEDRFWVRTREILGQRIAVPFASNGDFLINVLDNLSGSNDLIGLRSRGISLRPFTVVEELRRVAAEKFLARRDELQQSLEQTEKKLNELQKKQKAGSDGASLSPEEQAAVDSFRRDAVRIRKELREVQHSLNRDIDRLSTQVKLINIGLMPLGVAALALAMAAVRHHRRRVRVARE
jgi:ABC-type uncharacterized transport system involved in gliding motility auxiliary subunit